MKPFLWVLLTCFFVQNAVADNGPGALYVKRIFAARPRSMTLHFEVKIQCEPQGQTFLATPVKNQKFKWRFGDRAKSDLVTDNRGIAEFTYTSHDGKINETLEIELQGKVYQFTSAEGAVVIPQIQQCP